MSRQNVDAQTRFNKTKFVEDIYSVGMKRHQKKTLISGVKLIELESHQDDRGSLTELFRSDWFDNPETIPLQANMSISRKGVLRGLHFHRKQTDFWICVQGVLQVVLVDVRIGSPSWKEVVSMKLSAEVPALLTIPKGVAHGYYALQDVILVYLVDALYDGTDEHGLLWCDHVLDLPWALQGKPVISERDRSNSEFELLFKNKGFLQYENSNQ